MAEKLRIFVSATDDLESERSVIGRLLAELPIQVGAEVRRSPAEGCDYETLFELMSNVDRVYFLMGRDISAPAGVEWQLALRQQKSILPLRLRAPRTQAGVEFLRTTIPIRWRDFGSSEELSRRVGLDLIDLLLHAENRYGLSLTEIEKLRLRSEELRRGLVVTAEEAGGAEGGGVILDPKDALEGR